MLGTAYRRPRFATLCDKMIKQGDNVTFETMPNWVEDLPEESSSVFRACLGKRFRVTEVDDNGLCVLDVSQLIDPLIGGFMNEIHLGSEFLRKD